MKVPHLFFVTKSAVWYNPKHKQRNYRKEVTKMLQDIYPHKLYNQFDQRTTPSEEDIIMSFHKGEILCLLTEANVDFPRVCDLSDESCKNLIYLFKLDDKAYFLFDKEDESLKRKGYEYTELRSLRGLDNFDLPSAFAAHTAKHLADWYRDNAYCGRCGEKMTHSDIERAKVCPSCGYTAYPRIMPAVIVGVKNGDRMLLTKYKTGFRHNALVAGFTEIGETFEDTVKREVMEEAGIFVKNITYYKSQPWGLANDILAGFTCEVDGDDTITMDPNELSYAEWVKREDIVLQPDSYSLTNEIMRMFKEGKI